MFIYICITNSITYQHLKHLKLSIFKTRALKKIKLKPYMWVFTSGGQSNGASASASVLPVNIQGLFPLGLTGWISLLSKGFLMVFSNTTIRKHQFFSIQPSLWSSSHIRTWLLEKTQLWLYGPLLAKWILCFLIHCLSLPGREVKEVI